jgi:hypothetical protein
MSKIGDVEFQEVSYADIRRKLRLGSATGEPKFINFPDDSQAYVSPAPDFAYKVDIHYAPVFEAFTPGDEANFTFDIPDAYIQDTLWEGAAACLNAPHPDALASNPQWLNFINVSVPRIKAQRSGGSKTSWKDASAFTYG